MLCNLFRAEDTSNVGLQGSQQFLRNAIAEGRKGLLMLEKRESRVATGYRYAIFDNLSSCHFELQQYDSCIHYGDKALSIKDDGDQHLLHKRLFNTHKALGNEAKAAHFAELIINREPPALDERQAVSEVKADYEKQMEINRLESEQQLRRYRLHLWIVLLLLVVVSLLWMVFRYRKNKEIEMLHMREESMRLQEESLRLHSDNERIAHETRENLLRRVRKIYTDGKGEAYRRILVDFNATYPQACHNIREAYPTLSEQEIELCVLGFFGFRAKEVALLMELSENTINHYRTNIRKKTGVGDLKDLVKTHLE